MSFRVPEPARVRTHRELASTAADGNNGAFWFDSCAPGWRLFVIASDGDGWEHVSVHADRRGQARTPTWAEMTLVKDLFWDADDAVMQLHPPRASYVNLHPHTLHLWRPIAIAIPLPPTYMVGPRTSRDPASSSTTASPEGSDE
jgi:hypothetical protein